MTDCPRTVWYRTEKSTWVKSNQHATRMEPENELKKLRWILLEVWAISAKISYWKSTHSTVTFGTLSKTTHFSSFLSVTLRLNSQAFLRNLIDVKHRKNA